VTSFKECVLIPILDLANGVFCMQFMTNRECNAVNCNGIGKSPPTVNVKFFPVHTINAYMGSRGVAQLFLNFGTGWTSVWSVSRSGFFTPGKAPPPRYPSSRRLCGPQRSFGSFEKREISFSCRDSNPWIAQLIIWSLYRATPTYLFYSRIRNAQISRI
jgi:hypothetical protein